MKISKIKTLSYIAATMVLAGCSENAWNDNLDGFQKPPVYSEVKTVTYKLTDADYKTISGLSANKALATTDEEKTALTAIGTNLCFATKEQARIYLPAFFAQSSFPYFSLNQGSSIKVEYAIGNGVSSETDAINAGTPELKLSEQNYQAVWESDDDFINGFAPVKPAASYLPGLLKELYADAESGAYAVVNYNESATNPIFGTVSGGEEEEWTMTEVIKDLKVGDVANVRGIVTGISTRGFVVTDASGASICYDKGSGFNDDALSIGSQVNVTGEVSSYSLCMQIAVDNSYEIIGSQAYTYPSPVVYDGAAVTAGCERTADFLAEYISLEATVKVSGNYINLDIDGTDYQGSVYNAPDYVKSKLVDGEKMTLTGYFVCVSGKAKYFNILVTGVNGANVAKAPAMTKAPVADVEVTSCNAIYTYNGSKWTVPANTAVLQPADYTAMGQKYGNLSGNLDKTLLPIYLNANYPYAAAEDVMTVAYKYYNGSSTSYKASRFVFDGTNWTAGDIITEQFTLNEKGWTFNPSVTLTLEAGKGIALSATYYQACVDWVYENIDVPLGSTDIKSGIGYVTTYGNNEYYSGTSAYQNNIDLRASAARAQYEKGYEGMTDEQVVETEKHRFCYETFPGALSKLHADADVIPGMDVLYTFTFSAYYGTETLVYTGVWKVVGKGKFEFVSCVLNMDGQEATPFLSE